MQHDDRVSEAIKLAADRGVVVLEAGVAEMDRLTGGAIHQGLALRVRAYDYAHPDDLLARAADAGQLPLIAALDGVTDPRNLGAVVRSAAAFGAHGVVVPGRRGASAAVLRRKVLHGRRPVRAVCIQQELGGSRLDPERVRHAAAGRPADLRRRPQQRPVQPGYGAGGCGGAVLQRRCDLHVLIEKKTHDSRVDSRPPLTGAGGRVGLFLYRPAWLGRLVIRIEATAG